MRDLRNQSKNNHKNFYNLKKKIIYYKKSYLHNKNRQPNHNLNNYYKNFHQKYQYNSGMN